MSADGEKPHSSLQGYSQTGTMESSHHHDVFIQYYSKLTSILKIRIGSLVDHFISARIIGVEEKGSISVDSLLSTVESDLKSGINTTFCKLLDIMTKFGDLSTQDLAKSIKKKLTAVVAPTHEGVTVVVDEVDDMFIAFLSALHNVLSEAEFKMVRMGCITLSAKLPNEFDSKVRATETLYDLFDVLVSSPFCNWMNIRLLEKMAAASLQSNAHQLINQYKNAIFSKKLKDIFKHIPEVSNQIPDEYYSKIKQRWKKEFDDVTVKDVIGEWNKLEKLFDVEELMLLLDSNSNHESLSTSGEPNLTRLRTDGSNRNEECDELKSDDLCCGICNKHLFITNKCCNQIYCSKCLKEYLNGTGDDYTMPCLHCKAYMKKEKDIDDFDDHHLQHQADQTNVIVRVGHNCDFVETPPEDLMCKICRFPARDPQQTNECCGQTFCATCLSKYMDSKILDNKQCPFCKTVPFTFLPDAKTKHNIEKLKVFCPHKSMGCTWTGELRSLKEHLVKDIDNKKGCPFTELQCSNGCGVVMQRRLVEGHIKSECELREVKCEYCNTTGSCQWINSSHCEECPKYPVECPNHCEVGHVRREEISGHLEECPLVTANCLFTSADCESVSNSKTSNIVQHMREAVTPPHTKCVLQSTTELLQKTKKILENRILKIQIELDNSNQIIKHDFKIVTVNHQVTMEAENAKNHLTNQADGLDKQENKTELQAYNYKQGSVHVQATEDKFKTEIPKRGEELMQRFASKLRDNFEDLQDCTCRWSLRLNYLHNTCNNILPNVYMKISEFVLHPKYVIDSWSSKPFYTHDKGYKMCMSTSNNFDNNYVSVCVSLMSGEYDHYLQWPVKGTLKIQLLNQFYDGNHTDPVDIVFDGARDNSCCQRVLVGDKSHFGNCFETFISHRNLAEDVRRKQHYYKNSTLYFKILEFVDLHN